MMEVNGDETKRRQENVDSIDNVFLKGLYQSSVYTNY
jgi:hypothetical protein